MVTNTTCLPKRAGKGGYIQGKSHKTVNANFFWVERQRIRGTWSKKLHQQYSYMYTSKILTSFPPDLHNIFPLPWHDSKTTQSLIGRMLSYRVNVQFLQISMLCSPIQQTLHTLTRKQDSFYYITILSFSFPSSCLIPYLHFSMTVLQYNVFIKAVYNQTSTSS